jgi:hypothetical protein
MSYDMAMVIGTQAWAKVMARFSLKVRADAMAVEHALRFAKGTPASTSALEIKDADIFSLPSPESVEKRR